MEILFGIIFVLAILFAFICAGSWVFMTAWNFVLPVVFHSPTLTFWQSFAIIALLSVIASLFNSNRSSK